MKKQNLLTVMFVILIVLFFGMANIAFAEEGGDREPPKEAISACVNMDKGTTCSAQTPQGETLKGICSYMPHNKYFVCMMGIKHLLEDIRGCIGCGTCVETCPADVLRLNPNNGKAVIMYVEDCQIFHLCRLYCPVDTITISPEKMIPVIVSWG